MIQDEEPSDEHLHGVRVKRPRGRPKKRLPIDFRKATERFRVAPDKYCCIACDTDKVDAAPEVPLMCKACFAKYQIEGYEDPTQDVALLHFLYHNHHLPGITEATIERVNQESRHYHIDFQEARPT